MSLLQTSNPYCRLVRLMLELVVLTAVGAFTVFNQTLYTEGWFSAAKAVFFYLTSLLPPLFGWPVTSAPKVPAAVPDILVPKDDGKQPDPPSPPPPYSSVVPVQPVHPADKDSDAPSRPPPTPPAWEGYSMIPVKYYKDRKWSVYEAKYWNGAPLCRMPTVVPPPEERPPRAGAARPQSSGVRALPNPGLLAPPRRAVGGRALPARPIKALPTRRLAPPACDVARPVRVPDVQIRRGGRLQVPRVNDHSRLRHEDEVFYFPKLGRYFPRLPRAEDRDAGPGAFRLRKAVF